MSGKKVILFIVIFSVLAIIATWIYGQKVIDDLDLDRGLDSNSTVISLDDNSFY